MFCYSLANASPGSAPWPHTASATDFDKSMSHRILRTTSKGKRQYRSVDFSSRIVDFQRHEEEGLILLLKQVVANSHQLSANDGSQQCTNHASALSRLYTGARIPRNRMLNVAGPTALSKPCERLELMKGNSIRV